jgi:DNA-binding transcriptional LysR family regulator
MIRKHSPPTHDVLVRSGTIGQPECTRLTRGRKMLHRQTSVQCIVMIQIMRYEHIRKTDLNLLHTLAVLLEERHVSRAAKRCFLSQPAMSRALERLRETFGDELLIRSGRGYERTARGERLLKELESFLPKLESLLTGEKFDPGLSQDRFQVMMTDHACAVMLPGLVRRVARAAPKSRLEVVPWNDRRFEDIEAGRLDLLLDVAGAPAKLESETLFTDVFVCVVAANHPVRARRFTLDQYLKYPHVVVNVLSGEQTPIDRPLRALAQKRRVGLVIPFFAVAVRSVAQSNMILTLPKRLAVEFAKSAAVRLIEAPHEVKEFKYEMIWHRRLTDDPVHRWLRDQVRAVAKEL